jgi:hypothetical protein
MKNCAAKAKSSSPVRLSSASITAIAILLVAAALHAQNNVSLNGKVTVLKGQELTVETANGPALVKLSDKTLVRGEVPIKFSDITPGMYVGATAENSRTGLFVRPDCMFSAKTSAARARAIDRSARRREAASP